MADKGIRLKVWSEYACFTRPDLKVERMTYPCMTPSAARGVLDAILWKPEFMWHIQRIYILKPIKFVNIKRNEIKSRQSIRSGPIIIENKRTQRNSVVLKDVAYIIEATVENCQNGNLPQKYLEMFKRRAKKGQCYRRPFLGTREFSADFSLPQKTDKAIKSIYPVGSMLLDIYYDQAGIAKPIFFYDVCINNGVLECGKEYEQMLNSSHICPKEKAEVAVIDRMIKEDE